MADVETPRQGSGCPVCGAATRHLGCKKGVRYGADFELRSCPECTFSYVANPCTDFARIYDESYYAGQGSDPAVDYAAEYADPTRVIRQHDWQGITEVVSQLRPGGGTWLDFGCGTGSLVRHVKSHSQWDIHGHDTGAWAAKARSVGLPILTAEELEARRGTFDVVTAIEVIEHVVDPVPFLTYIRSLLRPGGLLFATTLNAQVAPADFVSWSYVIPEIHVSFFTPRALDTAFMKSGFQPVYPGFRRGWEKIIRFKILKNLGARRNAWWHGLLPWSLISRGVDAKYNVTRLPLGIAR